MILIKNAYIKTISNGDIHDGCILIDGGKIKEVAAKIAAPEGAEIIDAEGKLVTPGLIDAHCHVGLFGEGIRWEGADGNEISDPVTPQLRAIDSINPMEEAFENGLKGGVTTVGTGPGSANVIGGTFAAIKLKGKRIDDMLLKAEFAMKIAFGENPKNCYGQKGKAPLTRMSVAAILREQLFKAKRYAEDLDDYEKSTKEDKKRPAFDMKMEALVPVMRKQIPLKAHCHRADDIFTAIRISKEFGLEITLDHCTEGHLIVEELVKEGKPVLLGPTFGSKSKPEVKNKSFETLKSLTDAGLKVAIITDAPVIPIDALSFCAGLAVKAGVNEQKAWECITINPAQIMGVSDRVGSIEPGKDADIVIFDGNPLKDISCKVVCTIVDGEIAYKA